MTLSEVVSYESGPYALPARKLSRPGSWLRIPNEVVWTSTETEAYDSRFEQVL
jgi:hypothetical protein